MTGRIWSAIPDLTVAVADRTTVEPEMLFEDLAERVASVLAVEPGTRGRAALGAGEWGG